MKFSGRVCERLPELRDRKDACAQPERPEHLATESRVGDEDIAEQRQADGEVEEVAGEPRCEHRRNAGKQRRAHPGDHPPEDEPQANPVDRTLQGGALAHLAGHDDVEQPGQHCDPRDILEVGDRDMPRVRFQAGYPVQLDEQRNPEQDAVGAPLDRECTRCEDEDRGDQLHPVAHLEPARRHRGEQTADVQGARASRTPGQGEAGRGHAAERSRGSNRLRYLAAELAMLNRLHARSCPAAASRRRSSGSEA